MKRLFTLLMAMILASCVSHDSTARGESHPITPYVSEASRKEKEESSLAKARTQIDEALKGADAGRRIESLEKLKRDREKWFRDNGIKPPKDRWPEDEAVKERKTATVDRQSA